MRYAGGGEIVYAMSKREERIIDGISYVVAAIVAVAIIGVVSWALVAVLTYAQ